MSAGWNESAREFLEDHCNSCHSGAKPAAGLSLDQLPDDLSDRQTLGIWTRVHDKIEKHEMPPADAPQPNSSERVAVLRELRAPLISADLARQQAYGRTVLRRLNRVEYENTLRDLLALPYLEVKDSLPADGELQGFDTVGEALTISYVQQDAYLKAAEQALDRAAVLSPRPKELRFKFGFGDPNPRRAGVEPLPTPPNGLGLLTNANLDPPVYIRNNEGSTFVARGDGRYHLRYRARGHTYDNREQGGGVNGVLSDSEVPHVILLYAERPPFSRWLATFDLPSDTMGELELSTWLSAGEKIRQIHASLHENNQPYRPFEKPFFGTVVAMESFDIQGPYNDQWPPECYHRVFGDLPTRELPKNAPQRKPRSDDRPPQTLLVDSRDPQGDAARLVATFVERAFRRTPPASEIGRYTALAQRYLADGLPFQESLFAAYQAALCSPDFLFFQEQPGPLDGEALASRLSYFLWRSLPDEALLAAGRAGELRGGDTLQAQVERLLQDPRAERFVNDFTDQWLKLRDISLTQADPDLYPEYHEDFLLLDSLLRETRAYFADMLDQDLGVEFIVDSDFAFLNRNLAELYGLPGIEGSAIRKVPLPPDHIRGGLLTQASVLKVTANGTSTSPVTRGVWLMDRILGSPPPPPPADVPAIEADLSGAVTIRDQLSRHRQVAACASCHKQIDPPGFALECFDVLGGYRTQYRALGVKPVTAVVRKVKVKYGIGLDVDASGETAAGRNFRDLKEFQQILLEDKPRLARNLVERLITYSTGAPVQFGDRPDVDRIVERLHDQHFGLRSMIHEVVRSRMFQQK